MSALLRLPPSAAKEELRRRATAALMSEVARSKVQNDPRTAAMSEVARSKVQNDPRTAAHVRPPVEVRRSEVSAAGAGLFLRCDAPAARPGDLLALYAGVYTPPVPDITHAADGTSVLIPQPALREDGAYVVNLEGGGYLCGAEHALRVKENATRGLCAGWAVAALANHPPRGTIPNVEAIVVDWGDTMSDAARKYVNPFTTYPWYQDEGVSVFVPPTVHSRGLVFLASRTIEPGEEVLFNYRLSTSSKLPSWYAAVPDEISWSTVDEARKARKDRKWDQDQDGDWGGGLLN